MLLVGLLTVLFAVGLLQQAHRSAPWGPRLLVLFGLAYVAGGLLTADPASGFPPGATAETVQPTWQGQVQNLSRGISSLLLILTSLVFAFGFAAEGRRGAAWFCATAIPMVFAALTLLGFVIGGNPVALAFLMTPWIWVTALAARFHQREAAGRTTSHAAALATR